MQNSNQKQIIAIGGGTFTADDRLLFDKYLIDTFWKTKGKDLDIGGYRPKVCLIPTATGDWDYVISKFYSAYSQLECQPSHLSLFASSDNTSICDFLLSQDIIFVTGGNTFTMLAVWKAWGIDNILKECWESGVILAGSSAGSLCWFESGNTDSFGKELGVVECMGFIEASHSPHYDGEIKRRPHYQKLILEEKIKPGYAIDNFAAIHFLNQDVFKTMSTKPNAKAYFVKQVGEVVVEEMLKVEELK